MVPVALLFLLLASVGDGFAPTTLSIHRASSCGTTPRRMTADAAWYTDAAGLTLHPDLTIRDPTEEERGKGGVAVDADVKALEVLARIPRASILSSLDAPTRALEAAASATTLSWAADLTAATLAALHPLDEDVSLVRRSGATPAVLRSFAASFVAGGWGTDGADLGPPEANWGAKDVTGSLLATGSDNDHNIYAKFRMPCHPILLRAGNGLKVLTGDAVTEEQAREALYVRGRLYRAMRDALEGLVLEPVPRERGSQRERRCWDVADTLSRVLSRATVLHLDGERPSYAVVPLHERLGHSLRAHNSRLVALDDDTVVLVATRDLARGEAVTRDYTQAPTLDEDDTTLRASPLRLLLQFGLPPSAWS